MLCLVCTSIPASLPGGTGKKVIGLGGQALASDVYSPSDCLFPVSQNRGGHGYASKAKH